MPVEGQTILSDSISRPRRVTVAQPGVLRSDSSGSSVIQPNSRASYSSSLGHRGAATLSLLSAGASLFVSAGGDRKRHRRISGHAPRPPSLYAYLCAARSRIPTCQTRSTSSIVSRALLLIAIGISPRLPACPFRARRKITPALIPLASRHLSFIVVTPTELVGPAEASRR